METVCYTILHPETQQKEEMRFSKADNIGKVLISACKVFKIRPEKHELRYANRKLEPNMNLMFSDLPDDVLLEIIPVRGKDEKVQMLTVNLIFGDGTVNSGKFRKSATLWDVSQQLIPKDKFVEEDRICMSLLNKCFNGPKILKKVPLSSLKTDEGPLNLSLTRKYSSENVNPENDKNSGIRRNSKKCKDFLQLNRRDPNTAGTSVTSSNSHGSSTNQEDESSEYSLIERKEKSNKALKRIFRFSSYNPGMLMSRRQRNTNHLTDRSNVKTMIENNLTAKAAIDKHFYLNPGKRLNDLKYLNSRQGIVYVNKQLAGENSRENSAVELLDLGKDSNRSSGGNIEIKLLLPDETEIKAIFRFDETVEDVFNFLNPLLQCQPSDYFLYVSNSKEQVDKNISLNELEDSSGVNLHLDLNPKIKKTWPKCKPYLKEEHQPKKDNQLMNGGSN